MISSYNLQDATYLNFWENDSNVSILHRFEHDFVEKSQKSYDRRILLDEFVHGVFAGAAILGRKLRVRDVMLQFGDVNEVNRLGGHKAGRSA